MRSIIDRDDYVGFTYAGIHSSQFGIKSVTSGDRYQRYLSPEFQDVVSQVGGSDGTLYFGGNKTRREFNFNIAFDDMTEVEYRELRAWLNQGIQELIFDEQPYIKYYAKLSGSAQMSFLVFLDEQLKRVYKGEIGLSFTCYDPYGHSVYKWLNQYSDSAPSIGEWAQSSKLLPRQEFLGKEYDTYLSAGEFLVYNPGDLPVDFILEMNIADSVNFRNGVELSVGLDENDTTLTSMKFDLSDFTQYNSYSNRKICIDTNKRLVYFYYEAYDGTKNINVKTPINNYIVEGDFFRIPLDEPLTPVHKIWVGVSYPLGGPPFTIANATIAYDYKYL